MTKTKAELIAKFEKIKAYYGNKISLGELKHHIERSFPPQDRPTGFDKLLEKYIYDIHKLNQWNQECQSNQKL